MSNTQDKQDGFPPWAGPRYIRARRRGNDVLFVLRHLAAILTANASITAGLEATAEDGLRSSKVDEIFRSRLRTYLLCLVIFVSWNAFPIWQLIEPSRDLIFNDITIAMVLLEMVGLLLLGLRAWRERNSAKAVANNQQRSNRLLKAGKLLDFTLFMAIPLAFGFFFSAMLYINEEPYYGGMGLLFVALLIAALVLRARSKGLPPGPISRILNRRVISGSKRVALMRGLGEALQRGATLGEAMKELHDFFPAHVAGRICAAEQTGQLADTMYSVIDELEIETKQQARRAGKYLYLGIVLMLQLLLITFIAIKIIPVFAEILDEFGGDRPTPMRNLIAAGDFLIYKWPGIVTAIALAVIAITALYRYVPNAKWLWSRLLLALPVAGAFHRYKNASRVSRVLGDLLESGVPLHESLEICAAAGIGPVHASLLRQWIPLAEKGDSLAQCAQAIPQPAIMPSGFAAAALLGETSGAPQAALHHAADYYSDCAQRATALTDAISYPILLAPLGFLTYFITSAIYSTIAGFADAIFFSL